MIYELKNNLESAYMVHKYRIQGAGSPSYYDRVEKLKQSMPWLIICERTVFILHVDRVCKMLFY